MSYPWKAVLLLALSSMSGLALGLPSSSSASSFAHSKVSARSLMARASILRDRGKYLEALPLLQRALGIVEKQRPAPQILVAEILNQIGMVDKYAARFAEGEAAYRRALSLAVDGTTPPSFSKTMLQADVYHNLGGIYHAQERFAEGEPYARRAVEIRAKLLGATHPATIADEAALASLLAGEGKFAEAQEIYLRAIAAFSRMGRGHLYDVAINLNNLAAVYFEDHRPADAEPLYRKALEIKKRILGRYHPDVGNTLNNLGVLYAGEGRIDDARTEFRQALIILTRALGPEHPKVIECQENLAVLSSYP